MVAKTFLELTNRVIDECKITLDPLTQANFTNPPRTEMYNRVKRWINDALEELLTTRNEWFTRIERANVAVYPRVHLQNLLVPPLVGYVYQGRTSGVSFTVQAIHNFEFVEPSAADSEATLSVLFDEDWNVQDLVPTEVFDVIAPAPTFLAATLKGEGWYDFDDMVSTMERVDDTSLMLYDPPEEYQDDGRVAQYKVYPVSWNDNKVASQYLNYSHPGSMVRTIRQNPQGSYAFFPRLEKKYILSFDYTREITPMVEWNDTPVDVPDKYHLYLVWRAARSFADFQGDARLFSRTKKEEDKFMLWMERDEAPEVTVGSCAFYVR